MNILVCGGAGFIGSAFIRNYLNHNQNHSITNLDSLTIGSNLKNLESIQNQNYSFVKDDIRNEQKIMEISKDKDAIINFAAESHVDRSIANPKPFLETNIFGTYSLLEAARRYDKLFIHVSTDEIYGDAEEGNSFTENDNLNPSNPYSATKASADLLVSSYARTYGIKCITTRCTNNFGPCQFPEKLIPKTIIRLLKNLKVPLYGDGSQIRSWIYVYDHVQALEELLKKGKHGTYNITAYEEITNKTIVEKILDILGKSHSMIEYVGDRPGHDKRYSVDSSKIEKETGWKPRYNFDKALQDTVQWYLDNKQWWEPLIDENTLHPQPWTIKY